MTHTIKIGLVGLVLAAAGASYAYFSARFTEAPYFAVYVATGDLYFGQLHSFPELSLTNVHYLRQNPPGAAEPYTIARFSDASWLPRDQLFLNPAQIVWRAEVKNGSPVTGFVRSKMFEVPEEPER
jgi:hypothetical protein